LTKPILNFVVTQLDEQGMRPTRVLPIVGLDIGAFGCISLFGFGSGGRNFFEQ